MGCVVCTPKRKTIGRSRSTTAITDNGLIRNSTMSNLSTHGVSNIHHLHETEQMDKPYGLNHDIPRVCCS